MIETERLILRPFRIEEDREPFGALNADRRVADWLGGPLTRQQSDGLIDRINGHIVEHGFGFWAAELKAERRLVGAIGLQVVRAEALPLGPAVEAGWRLAYDVWGQGLVTEGASAALAWAFARLPIHEVVAFTGATNLRSQAVMRRIGMTADPARDFDHPRLAEDHPLRRHVVYAIARP